MHVKYLHVIQTEHLEFYVLSHKVIYQQIISRPFTFCWDLCLISITVNVQYGDFPRNVKPQMTILATFYQETNVIFSETPPELWAVFKLPYFPYKSSKHHTPRPSGVTTKSFGYPLSHATGSEPRKKFNLPKRLNLGHFLKKFTFNQFYSSFLIKIFLYYCTGG